MSRAPSRHARGRLHDRRLFRRASRGWGAAERDWFEALLDEQDVDIMAWAIGTAEAPERFEGPMLDALQKLDYIQVAPMSEPLQRILQRRRRR